MFQNLNKRMGQLKARISDSRHIVALTGAGVSAESEVPTFRGKNGLWNDYRAEDLATPDAFARNPDWFGSGTTGEDNLLPLCRIIQPTMYWQNWRKSHLSSP